MAAAATARVLVPFSFASVALASLPLRSSSRRRCSCRRCRRLVIPSERRPRDRRSSALRTTTALVLRRAAVRRPPPSSHLPSPRPSPSTRKGGTTRTARGRGTARGRDGSTNRRRIAAEIALPPARRKDATTARKPGQGPATDARVRSTRNEVRFGAADSEGRRTRPHPPAPQSPAAAVVAASPSPRSSPSDAKRTMRTARTRTRTARGRDGSAEIASPAERMRRREKAPLRPLVGPPLGRTNCSGGGTKARRRGPRRARALPVPVPDDATINRGRAAPRRRRGAARGRRSRGRRSRSGGKRLRGRRVPLRIHRRIHRRSDATRGAWIAREARRGRGRGGTMTGGASFVVRGEAGSRVGSDGRARGERRGGRSESTVL